MGTKIDVAVVATQEYMKILCRHQNWFMEKTMIPFFLIYQVNAAPHFLSPAVLLFRRKLLLFDNINKIF